MDPEVRSHGMKANPPGYLWSKYERFLASGCQDMNLNIELLTQCDWNVNADDYNRSLFTLYRRAKNKVIVPPYTLKSRPKMSSLF